MKKLIIASALLFLTDAHAGLLPADPDVRFAVTPMLGLVDGSSSEWLHSRNGAAGRGAPPP